MSVVYLIENGTVNLEIRTGKRSYFYLKYFALPPTTRSRSVVLETYNGLIVRHLDTQI